MNRTLIERLEKSTQTNELAVDFMELKFFKRYTMIHNNRGFFWEQMIAITQQKFFAWKNRIIFRQYRSAMESNLEAVLTNDLYDNFICFWKIVKFEILFSFASIVIRNVWKKLKSVDCWNCYFESTHLCRAITCVKYVYQWPS